MNGAILDSGGILFLSLYLLSLILIGVAGKFASKESSLKDFYLGGQGFGVTILFLTMYATQYSGNSLIGFAGNAYRNGWLFLVSVTFMMAIVGGYLLYAPKLFPLAKKRNFITVGDYIDYRYKHNGLTLFVVGIGIMALANYMLTNLKAIGYIIEVVTGGTIGFETGIILMALIMVIYETLGGMRSVAWTDAIQGILLFFGVLIIFAVVMVHYGSPAGNHDMIRTLRPEFFSFPALENQLAWLSTLVLIFFGIAVYPQAIQRIYSAKNERTLRRSFQLMVIMPLLTTLPLIVIAITATAYFPDLSKTESEQVVLLMLEKLSQIEGMGMVITLFVAAAIAAIMSTVDSAMLAIASLFTQDIYHRFNPGKSQRHLTYVGKVFSWLLMGMMVYMAIALPSTIWYLIQIKLEILCQIAPAIMLGIHWRNLDAKAVFAGIGIGVLFTLTLLLTDLPSKPFGFHAGVIGLVLNFLTVFLFHLVQNRKRL